MAAEGKLRPSEYSSVISVREFKQQFLPLIPAEALQKEKIQKSSKDTAEEMGISEEIVTELAEVCSPSNLKCSAEVEIDPYYNRMDFSVPLPDGVQLETLRLAKENLLGGNNAKLRQPIDTSGDSKDKPGAAEDFEPVGANEVVFSVAIYHPTRLVRSQEFLVLGKQKLTSLRDVIYCIEDMTIAGDQSENRDLVMTKKMGELFKSGFFFIEGVFYNDMRDPLAHDYSKTIMDWIMSCNRSKDPGLGIFTSKSMDDVTFEELKVKLGYPYYYCHQGNCEHLLVFKDLRFHDCDDQQNALKYPDKVYELRSRRRICVCCELFTAVWMVRNDLLATEDPAFFCERCYKTLHYTRDGQKIGNFQAFSYTCEPWQMDPS